MDKFIIYPSKLSGEVQISGAKNSALPIMAATLLTDETCYLKKMPNLSDINTMSKLLECLGKKVQREGDRVTISSTKKRSYVAPYRLVRTMRASFCVLGPLLVRRKKAKVSLPGGCVIGVRPVDLHLKGLRELGAKIKIEQGYCYAQAERLKAEHIFLGGIFGPSVLATANVMMAASLAEGETIIEAAACEPEIVDLANFLNAMGAKIIGAGTPIIHIKGVKELSGQEWTVISDRIEAGTFIAASLATQSPILIKNINPNYLTAVLEVTKQTGAVIEKSNNSIKIIPPDKIKPVNITTLPYPGFPTDLQAQFMSVLTKAKGISIITEKIYPDRFMHIPELNRMGAKIIRNGPYAVIEGVAQLQGAEVMASDLRASAALVIAGMIAEGKTVVQRIYHLDRGYENLEIKLRQLGAKIKRVSK